MLMEDIHRHLSWFQSIEPNNEPQVTDFLYRDSLWFHESAEPGVG